MLRTLQAVLAATAFATCDTGVVSLTTDRRAYVPPAALTVTLDNGSGVSVGFNLCFVALEQRAAGGWIVIAWMPPGVPCAESLLVIAAGRSSSGVLELRADLPQGEYRVVARIEHADGGVELVASAPFVLAAASG